MNRANLQVVVRFCVVLALLPTISAAKPGDSFKTVDEAALDAIDFLKKEHPDWKKFEYGGCIYQEGVVFKASPPQTRYDPQQCLIPKPPPGTTMVGDHHSHTSKEEFSKNVDLNTNNQWPLFLLTPSERVLKYTPADKKIIQLR